MQTDFKLARPLPAFNTPDQGMTQRRFLQRLLTTAASLPLLGCASTDDNYVPSHVQHQRQLHLIRHEREVNSILAKGKQYPTSPEAVIGRMMAQHAPHPESLSYAGSHPKVGVFALVWNPEGTEVFERDGKRYERVGGYEVFFAGSNEFDTRWYNAAERRQITHSETITKFNIQPGSTLGENGTVTVHLGESQYPFLQRLSDKSRLLHPPYPTLSHTVDHVTLIDGNAPQPTWILTPMLSQPLYYKSLTRRLKE